MPELIDFSTAANASEQLNFNVNSEVDNINKLSSSVQSSNTSYMNKAWTVCYATTIIILLFYLCLWYYFETTNGESSVH